MEEQPINEIFELMIEEGYDSSTQLTLKSKKSHKYRLISTLDQRIQIKLQIGSSNIYQCIVLAKNPDVMLDDDLKKSLRKTVLGDVRAIGERFAEARNSTQGVGYANR